MLKSLHWRLFVGQALSGVPGPRHMLVGWWDTGPCMEATLEGHITGVGVTWSGYHHITDDQKSYLAPRADFGPNTVTERVRGVTDVHINRSPQ